MIHFEKPFEEMNIAELEAAYDHMVRNADSAQVSDIESEGPLSANEFIRTRQLVFRRLDELRREAKEFMHAPI